MTRADVGLALEKRSRGRGYGEEVANLLLREVFEQLNLHRAEWWTFAENTASVELGKKMGFREEGRLRDVVFFDNRYHDMVVLGILKDDYEKGKP